MSKILFWDESEEAVAFYLEHLTEAGHEVTASFVKIGITFEIALVNPEIVIINYDLPCSHVDDIMSIVKAIGKKIIVLVENFDDARLLQDGGAADGCHVKSWPVRNLIDTANMIAGQSR